SATPFYHILKPSNRLHSPDEHRPGTIRVSSKVEAVIHPVGKVNVHVSVCLAHYASLVAASHGMRSEVRSICLSLDNTPFAYARDQSCSDQVVGNRQSVAAKEGLLQIRHADPEKSARPRAISLARFVGATRNSTVGTDTKTARHRGVPTFGAARSLSGYAWLP